MISPLISSGLVLSATGYHLIFPFSPNPSLSSPHPTFPRPTSSPSFTTFLNSSSLTLPSHPHPSPFSYSSLPHLPFLLILHFQDPPHPHHSPHFLFFFPNLSPLILHFQHPIYLSPSSPSLHTFPLLSHLFLSSFIQSPT